MINIFNLFLILLFGWIILAYASHNISWPLIYLGIFLSALISFFAAKIKLIDKNSNFLFLNFGFYKHFIKLIIPAFFYSIILLFAHTFSKKIYTPVIYHLPIKHNDNSKLAMFIATISLLPGLNSIGSNDNEIMIHALDEIYFDKNKIEEIYSDLYNINEDSLV
jgi:multisubunit Na+/H+ antiporter MnhE subunit